MGDFITLKWSNKINNKQTNNNNNNNNKTKERHMYSFNPVNSALNKSLYWFNGSQLPKMKKSIPDMSLP